MTKVSDIDGLQVINGVGTKLDVSNLSSTPSAAELLAAFPRAVNAGTADIYICDDNNGHTGLYLVAKVGTTFGFVALTVAS